MGGIGITVGRWAELLPTKVESRGKILKFSKNIYVRKTDGNVFYGAIIYISF